MKRLAEKLAQAPTACATVQSKAWHGNCLRYTYAGELLMEIQHPSKELCLDQERGLLEKLDAMMETSSALQSRLVVRGEALTHVPHGFLCVHGEKPDIMELLDDTVLWRKENSAACLSLPKLQNTLKSGNIDAIRSFVQKRCPLRVSEEMQVHQRLRFACRHIDVNKLRTSDQYVYALLEYKHNVQWLTLPGGKRRLGEDSLSCAFREMKEETGINLDFRKYITDEDDMEELRNPPSVHDVTSKASTFFVHAPHVV